MLCLAMDASIGVAIYVPFSCIYHNLKWIASFKNMYNCTLFI